MPVSYIRQKMVATYQGPGDIVSGATAWYGLRAYNAAYATGSNNAINVRRASDNSTSNIVILANGNLDIATANTFAGVDATASATTTGSSTTIALTSASSTPHAGSTITGSGITQPCYIVSVGSFVGGAGTITVNAAQSIPVAETISMQYGLFVTEAYDQTGNGHHVTQATAGTQPQLLPVVQNGLPGLYCNGSQYLIGIASSSAIVQPLTFSGVAAITATGSNTSFISAYNGTTTAEMGITGTVPSSTSGFIYAGSVSVGALVTSGAAHSLQGVFNGASSVLNVDGSATMSLNPGTGSGNVKLGIMSIITGGGGMTGYFYTAGEWPFGFNSTQYGGMHTNDSAYWGTP